jgi:hypothetical protein
MTEIVSYNSKGNVKSQNGRVNYRHNSTDHLLNNISHLCNNQHRWRSKLQNCQEIGSSWDLVASCISPCPLKRILSKSHRTVPAKTNMQANATNRRTALRLQQRSSGQTSREAQWLLTVRMHNPSDTSPNLGAQQENRDRGERHSRQVEHRNGLRLVCYMSSQ